MDGGRKGRGGRGRGDKSRTRKGGGGRGGKAPTKQKMTPEEEAEKKRVAEEAAREKQLEEIKSQEKAAEEKAAAELKAKEDARNTELKDSQALVQGIIDSVKQRAEYRSSLEDLMGLRKEFAANKKKLKADLKKCSAVPKKIRAGTYTPSDIASLNLSRYVEEVVAAIVESKPKLADIPALVSLCHAMHSRYSDFLPNLIPALWTVVNKGKSSPDLAKTRRVFVRLLTEFHLSGMVPEAKPIVKCINEAAGGKEFAVQDANVIVAFAKTASPELFGVIPKSCDESVKWIEMVDGFDESTIAGVRETVSQSYESLQKSMEEVQFTPEQKTAHERLVAICKGAFGTLSKSLVQTHGKLLKLEKRCAQDRLLAGSLSEAREKGLNDARKLKESLQKSVEVLADVMRLPMPELEEAEEDEEPESSGLEVYTKEGGAEDSSYPFDDEETRAFYMDIPDLLTTVPPAVLGMTESAIEAKQAENVIKYGENVAEETAEESLVVDVAEDFTDEEKTVDGADEVPSDPTDDVKDTPHYRLMELLEQELPECNRREQSDDITERFCTNFGSSKSARKKLLNALFHVQRSRLDLLPYYSRMTATLDRVWNDIGPDLVKEVEQQFHGQAKFKKNQNIESRMKTARYVGELTKFRVAPPIVFLRCMHRCLEDFTGSNVDIACCLMESSGRFLFRLQHTTKKVSELMEQIRQLSKVKHLDERHKLLITAAFYTVKPPSMNTSKKAKLYSPLESYIRFLLITHLSHTSQSCSYVAKQISKMPFDDPSQDCGALVSRLMLKACRKGRYKITQAIAKVTANLRTHQVATEAAVMVIDTVIEELALALRKPDFRDQQRVITYARLLGDLFVSTQVSAGLIMEQLYSFINVGHEIPDALRRACQDTESNADQREETLTNFYLPPNAVVGAIQEDEEMEQDELEANLDESEPIGAPVAVSEHSKCDPRVFSPEDPPNSAFRVKLVISLLDVCSKQLMARNNRPRLKSFLTALQRYLFTKSMLPMDVEFALLDTFDTLDSHWKRVSRNSKSDGPERETSFQRFTSWLDAHNTTVADEESDSLANKENKDTLTDDGDEVEGDFAGEDYAVDNENDESVYSDERSNEEDTIDEDEYMSENDEEVVDEAKFEDDAFEQELRRLTVDAMEKGKSLSRKVVGDSMPSGSHVVRKKPSEGSKSVGSVESNPMLDGVSFQVLRRGNKGKISASEVVVPVDTNLAKVATKQDDEAARERDVIKQRVLDYEAKSGSQFAGGNVYLEQEKLQVIRNRPLSMADIDKNFGTSGGNLRTEQPTPSTTQPPPANPVRPHSRPGRGGRSRGRGRGGRNSSGRTLF